jgi:oligopeptide/dipeptide ABC transporter ATP-binding protein
MEQIPLKGEITSPINMKDDCHFAARCPYADESCLHCCPDLTDRGSGHFVACHKF